MNAKVIVAVQVIVLAGVVMAGTLLNNNVSDGPRDLHRLLGMLAGLVGLVAAVIVTMKGKNVAKLFAWLAFLLSVLAGAAGRGLKTATDYDKTFMVMRGAGLLALVCALVVLVVVMKSKAAVPASSKTEQVPSDDEE